jgi:hypothetical protein
LLELSSLELSSLDEDEDVVALSFSSWPRIAPPGYLAVWTFT